MLEVGESWLSKESSAKVLRILSRSKTIQKIGMSYCDLSMDDAWHSLAYLIANAPKFTDLDISAQRGNKRVKVDLVYAKKGRQDGVAKVLKQDEEDTVLAETPTKKLLETSKVSITQ